MPLYAIQATSNTTPDAGQGGLAVTSPSNTGHASSTAAASGILDSQQRTCIWSGFGSVPGQITAITLKIDHTSSGGKTAWAPPTLSLWTTALIMEVIGRTR